MRLDLLFEPFYVLSSLLGGLPGSQACPLIPRVPSSVVRETARPLPSGALGGVTAFVNVNVVPMDAERVLLNRTVLVERGWITALGPSSTVAVPAGAMRIDGQGKYLMPGLADMHAHYFPRSETYDQLVYRLFANLANGITTLRYATRSGNDKMWKHFQTAEVLTPRLYLARSDITSDIVRSGLKPDSMTSYVAAYKAAGYDYIPMRGDYIGYPEKKRTVFDSLLAAGYRLGLPAASHTNNEPFEGMLALGAYGGSVEHLYAFRDLLMRSDDEVSTAEIQARAAATKRSGAWITVTLDCTEQQKRPTGNIQTARRIVKALQDAGVGLLLGADADGAHGQSSSVAHEELAEMVRAGLTPYEALLTGTRNVAQYFHQLDELGTVAVGKRADLVLLHGNPLEDLRYAREPAAVMIGGRWVSRAELDERLLALPAFWFKVEVIGGFMPQLTGEQMRIGKHVSRFAVLTDSLELTQWSEYGEVLQSLAGELGAIRAILTPQQREAFDPKVRAWIREYTRRGYAMAVPGVASLP